jgi:hypothetical protein
MQAKTVQLTQGSFLGQEANKGLDADKTQGFDGDTKKITVR